MRRKRDNEELECYDGIKQEILERLHACPFCGEKEDVRVFCTEIGNDLRWQVVCRRCGVSMLDNSTRGIVEKWNRRQYLANIIEEYYK